MLTLHDITYIHPNRDVLFTDLNFSINKQDKIALTGNNGVGKSSLLKIIAGNLNASKGFLKTSAKPYYVPQLFGQFNDCNIAQALNIGDKIKALNEILNGNLTDENLALLAGDWAIEERCKDAFSQWKLKDLELTQKMGTLSGGQKTKVFLAGIIIHQPEIILLDEPSNHLDASGRNLLYDFISTTKSTLLVVSHDRALLNLMDNVYELSQYGLTIYGGNYDFYLEQKMIENDAMDQDLRSKEKALRKAKETKRESLERQQKLDARGKKKQEKAGLPTISMNTFKNNAEKSTSRLKNVHNEKIDSISHDLNQLRASLSDLNKMKIDLRNPVLHRGKILLNAKDINFGFDAQPFWKHNLNFHISSGERIAIKGQNGSGKTTLIKMILGKLQPLSGNIYNAAAKPLYIDQDYSLINDQLNVYEQVQQYNSGALQEHEIKIRLNRFLFAKEYWDKPCKGLSGGEKMRLMLCSLTISSQTPDLLILDEPTNNLDLQNIEILTAAVNEYKGTLIVVSHDVYFLEQINVGRSITV